MKLEEQQKNFTEVLLRLDLCTKPELRIIRDYIDEELK